MTSFGEAIEAARQGPPSPSPSATPSPGDGPDPSGEHGGPRVQLSVRVSEELRSAVASVADARGLTVTAFVEGALQRAVVEASDSFAGLAAELGRNLRAELASAVEDGAYRQAAAEVDREEAWS